ncbi:class I SAM-dependent methyltransferase [Alphaproteobacteria bacterium]|nr:class I SAM-dependent methyltransferase [Alphaproteobacteria bacterium]
MPLKFLTNKIRHKRIFKQWDEDSYSAPSPPHVKRKALLRNGWQGASWVETGTYRGDTTALLADNARFVHSIEPEVKLFEAASIRFAKFDNVEILKGTSEEVFPELLPKLSGDVNFWLDGHFSGSSTFQGATDTPVVEELRSISANVRNFDKIAVLVDDIRLFDPRKEGFQSYPDLDFLVDWARKHNLHWHIEHDIFIAKTDKLSG